MKVLKGPDPIKCTCCGAEIEYEHEDVNSYTKSDKITLFGSFERTRIFFIRCPVCDALIELGHEPVL